MSCCSSALIVGLALAAGCARGGSDPGLGLDGLAAVGIRPATVLPGTRVVVEGRSLVTEATGALAVRFRGDLDNTPIDVAVRATFVDFEHLELLDLGGALAISQGEFRGDVLIEVTVGDVVVASNPVDAQLSFRPELSPDFVSVQSGGVSFANDEMAVEGDGLLLGGDEGTTYAVVSGCLRVSGPACQNVGPLELPVTPESEFDRTRGSFPLAPELVGIRPAQFTGTVVLRNTHNAGSVRESDTRPILIELVQSGIFAVSPTAASLGQYVIIDGGGFVGGDNGVTLIRLAGTFVLDGGPGPAPVDLQLVPEFVDGRQIRYVLNQEDALGQALDLRTQTGTFTGDITPIVSFGADEVEGEGMSATLRVAPVKQVVYLRFAPSYVDSLRHFGLRAVDGRIRDRVLVASQADFATLNVEFRSEPPTDFALYSQVDIAGPDPNGLGLLGYDNTPGKDTDNLRLYDRIGGVNALTQEDGYPGFGGVFIESLFGFSTDPGGFAEPLPGADQIFDELFDPFRPDRGGSRVVAVDLSGGIETLERGDSCPALGDRKAQLACAVFALGSVISNTVSHELGHSLGLANPYSEGFHNPTDVPNRLMDSGSARPFNERAQLLGQGPARFCDAEYDYLRNILPTSEPADTTARPGCL